ncbi:hypothetical protein [Aporhodopirellula aestuarii]|uniref:Protein kinase domain-containing protein n=1 Tax=Aporhodopirellula aestuarii TaxID=2950107 RepID=A0ABT0U540_9BACT|nr:hypothetical protein [Aporhodopirellula aestuarii]MCM2371912.1 hypothetical protein [Aporhodopirellula aestuarii]
MMQADNLLTSLLTAYLNEREDGIPNPNAPLGIGEDGAVYRTASRTAVKIFYRSKNYERELGCYLRLRDVEVTEVAGFAVPELIDHDDERLIIEMGIVTPPRLLDFGKAYLDRPGPFSPDLIAEHFESKSADYSDADWSRVLDAYYELKSYGIYYYDLRPANIQVRAE